MHLLDVLINPLLIPVIIAIEYPVATIAVLTLIIITIVVLKKKKR